MELSLFFQEEWDLEFVKLFPFPQVLVKWIYKTSFYLRSLVLLFGVFILHL
jgi:hypothetical protein